MTSAEASKLLELPDRATPEQVEARFHELRTKLEEKIGKAPTPGLKAKYRETLDEITAAFETLILAADSSALPVLRREQGAGSKEQGRGMETGDRRPEAGAAATSPRKKSGGMEFILVAIIAVVVLIAGGWWVVKTQAETAEKARIAAEAKLAAEARSAAEKAEQSRKAEEARIAAEARRQAEEAERARLAAAEKVEQSRRDQQAAVTRAKLATFKIAWEAMEQESRNAARALSELRADERTLTRDAKGEVGPDLLELRDRLAAQQDFTNWLEQYLARHPFRVARVQAEEHLSARDLEAATRLAEQAEADLRTLEEEVGDQKRVRLQTTGSIRFTLSPPGAKVTIVDAYGRKRTEQDPVEVKDLPAGRTTLEIHSPGFVKRQRVLNLRRGAVASLEEDFRPFLVKVKRVRDTTRFGLRTDQSNAEPTIFFVTPQEAAKQEDGQWVFDRDCVLALSPGRWVVQAYEPPGKEDDDGPAYDYELKEVSGGEGAQEEVTLAPRKFGYLEIVSDPPGAEVTRGILPVMEARPGRFMVMSPGRLTLQLKLPGYLTQEITVEGEYERTKRVEVKLTPDDGTKFGGIGVTWLRNSSEPERLRLQALFLDPAIRAQVGSAQADAVAASFSRVDGKLYVLGLVPGGPAARAGLASGDQIISIADGTNDDGSPSKPAALDGPNEQIINLIRGPVGRPVCVTVKRTGDAPNLTRSFTIEREAIAVALPATSTKKR